MVRAGLIVGGITLVLGIIGGFILPLVCIPCVALFAGLGGGYLAGQFERPGASGDSARRGAGAGAIGGVGALLAHVISGAANALMIGPEGAAQMLRNFGLELPGPAGISPASYYAGAIGGACCIGVLEVALMAGLGAVGGMIWYQTRGRSSTPPAPAL
jgi:hypothetical protein